MTKEEKTTVANTTKNEIAVIDFAADSGKGNENITGKDLAIPMLQLLQINSPQVNEDDALYIDGAKPGDIMDTVTKAIYSKREGLKIVLSAYFSEFVEWRPRDTGGGLVARHQINTPLAQQATKDKETGKLFLSNGNTLVETHYHIGVMRNKDGALTWVIIPMTSTKLPISKKLNKIIMDVRVAGPNGPIQPARFASVFTLNSVTQENAKGKFYNYDFKRDGLIDDVELYKAAKELNTAFEQGQVIVQVVEEEPKPENKTY